MLATLQHRPSLLRTAATAFLFAALATTQHGQQKTPATTLEISRAVAWDTAFQDRSGSRPLHFTARYVDGHGTVHRLEEWRDGQAHLRRKTDDRIDLHADAASRALPNQPPDYTWQVLDLQRHVAHRVSTAGMLHLGMLYSYYSMAHLLTRPAGSFTVVSSSAPAPVAGGSLPASALKHDCRWWQIDAPGQNATRVCWMPEYGVPAQTWSQAPGGWRLTFTIDALDQRAFPARVFVTDTTGFQVRNVDEMESDD